MLDQFVGWRTDKQHVAINRDATNGHRRKQFGQTNSIKVTLSPAQSNSQVNEVIFHQFGGERLSLEFKVEGATMSVDINKVLSCRRPAQHGPAGTVEIVFSSGPVISAPVKCYSDEGFKKIVPLLIFHPNVAFF